MGDTRGVARLGMPRKLILLLFIIIIISLSKGRGNTKGTRPVQGASPTHIQYITYKYSTTKTKATTKIHKINS